jgi:hypothetical protein
MSALAEAARAAILLDEDVELSSASEPEVAEEEEDQQLQMDDEGFYGEEDRIKLYKLSQLERESILFDRKQQWKEKQDRIAALSRLKEKKVAEKRRAPQKKGLSGKDKALESIRERKRNRNAVRRTDEFEESEEEEVVESDEEDEEEDEDFGFEGKGKGKGRAKKQQKVKRGKKRRDDYYSEDEEEEYEDEEEGRIEEKKRVALSLPVTHTPLTLQSLKNIQMRRAPLEKICSEGFFDEFVNGMFVRIRAGVSRTTNQNIYRIAEIVGVKDYHSKYTLNDGTVTKKVLKLHHPSLEDREFKILDVSNSGFTQEEMNHWIDNMNRAHEKVFSAEEAAQRAITANHYRKTYKYTPEEVERLIKERQELSGLSVNYTKQIIDLETEIARLARSGNEEEAKKLSYRLDEIREKDEQQRRRQTAIDRPLATGLHIYRAKPIGTVKKTEDASGSLPPAALEQGAILDSEVVAALEISDDSLPQTFRDLYKSREVPKEMKILAKLHNFDLGIDLLNPPVPQQRKFVTLFGNRFTVYPYSVKPSHLVTQKPAKSFDFDEYFQAINK